MSDQKIIVELTLVGGADWASALFDPRWYDVLKRLRPDLTPRADRLQPLLNFAEPADGGGQLVVCEHLDVLRRIAGDGHLAVYRGVGNALRNTSHFEAARLRYGGTTALAPASGYLGRALDGLFPDFPDAYPSAAHPYPPALALANPVRLLTRGARANHAMNMVDPTILTGVILNGGTPLLTDGVAADDLEARTAQRIAQTSDYAGTVHAANERGTSVARTYFGHLGRQLRGIIKQITGGAATRAYTCTLNGFDTHALQSEHEGHYGTLPGLWRELNLNLEAFYDDLLHFDLVDRLTVLVDSEFGRRIGGNGSGGTDHGTAGPVLLLGGFANGRSTLRGQPDAALDPAMGRNDQLPITTDIRTVQAELLSWFNP